MSKKQKKIVAFLWPLLRQNCSLLPPSSSPPLLLNTTCLSPAIPPWTVGWDQFCWSCWSTCWLPVLGWRRTLRTTHRIPSCWTPAWETLAGHEKQPAGHEDQPSGQPPASLPGLGAGHPPAQLANKTPDSGEKEARRSPAAWLAHQEYHPRSREDLEPARFWEGCWLTALCKKRGLYFSNWIACQGQPLSEKCIF